MEHLSRHKLIRSTQHGFVNGRSTQSNLLEYMELLTKLVDEDTVSFIVKFADDSKAWRVVDSQEDRDAFQAMLNRLDTWSQDLQLLFTGASERSCTLARTTQSRSTPWVAWP